MTTVDGAVRRDSLPTAAGAAAPVGHEDRWARLRIEHDSGSSGRRPSPRPVHPGAWWLWALGLAACAMRCSNPLLAGLVIAVAAFVVTTRRTDAPWSRSFAASLRLGAALIVFRVVLSMLFALRMPGHELFALPSVTLPSWAAGVGVGGPVTVELVVRAASDGLRLAAVVACMGAANALASPRRLLRAAPAVLYEAAVAVTVALAFVPEVVAELDRLREARRLRGHRSRGVRALRGLALPVLEGGLDRSIALAASMDARGYGRRQRLSDRERRMVSTTTLVGVLGLALGVYSLLDPSAPPVFGLPVLVVSVGALAASMAVGGRRTPRTRYRPDPWRGTEWLVALSAAPAVVAVTVAGRSDPDVLTMPTAPLAWPAAPGLAVVGILVATAAVHGRASG